MLKRYSTFFKFFRIALDIIITAGIWIIVYYIRFQSELVSYPKGITPFEYHLKLTIPITALCCLAYSISGLYEPKRIQNFFSQSLNLLKATILSGLLIMAFLYYTRPEPYSRKLLFIFIITLFLGLSLSHLLVMKLLRFIRKKGYNQRHFAVIGTGNKAIQLVKDIENIKWLGLRCAFFVSNESETDKKQLLGKPVYTPVSRILELVKTRNVDEVYLALDKNGADIYPILEALQSQGIIIRIVPSWGNLISISKPTIVPVGSQFLFSAGDSPLTGVNVIIKELFDRIVAFLLLVVFAVPMAIIALLIKLTSKGPVFYKQTRIGMDQRKFEMLKFRTMHINPEDQKTPKWTAENDSRRTGIGKFLRRTSIDELPQLINVLKGEMSLVGPRPEQPYFVEQFSENHRRYMLRHKVKAGMTGWAQIHGMRGDTSLRKRLVYDLYYVKNWSLALDLWILLRTPMHILKGENAY